MVLMGNVWRSYTCIGADNGLPETTFPMAPMSRGLKCHINNSWEGWQLVKSPHITGPGTFPDDVSKGRHHITNSKLIIRNGLMKRGTPTYYDSNS
jgi:hypothetical protein